MRNNEKIDLTLDNIEFEKRYGRKKTIATFTLGCKVNVYDTEAMLEFFKKSGYKVVDFSENADVYLINTCTVTNLSDKKSRQFIRKAKNQNDKAVIVVTGCYAQISSEEVEKIEGVNIIIGNKYRNKIVEKVENYNQIEGINNNVIDIKNEYKFEELLVSNLNNKTRAYLKIQEGCDQYCSYCIIPYARGHIRSRNYKDILDEVDRLVKNNFKEIVLTGIHVASYGKDLEGINLIKLLKNVHSIENLKRIRLSSIEPNLINDEFIFEIKNLNKICDHFHLSLQSGCDKILKSMNRKYTKYEFEKSVNLLRSIMPNVSITTDIIVGFPGESKEDFEETLKFVKKIKFAKIHVFPFSRKKGTKAYKMGNQISNKIKNERVKELIMLGKVMEKNFIESFINKELNVLYENEIGINLYEGYSTNYIKVRTCSDKILKNNIFNTKISNIEDLCAISYKI